VVAEHVVAEQVLLEFEIDVISRTSRRPVHGVLGNEVFTHFCLMAVKQTMGDKRLFECNTLQRDASELSIPWSVIKLMMNRAAFLRHFGHLYHNSIETRLKIIH